MRAMQAARQWQHVPILGPLAESFIFGKLAFIFELAVNFIQVRRRRMLM
jgi:hypothetical protein